MPQRSGSADLPLHGGRVPPWLAARMARLGAVIAEAIVHHYGRDEFLRRLSHPFWFQSFGAVMGMDWHSSGITTSVIGALKRGLRAASGRARPACLRRSRPALAPTPDELIAIGERVGFDGAALARASRLVAKVDSAAVQDGFELYLHGFIVADDGNWAVVQQGMNGDKRQARRYHWQSEGLPSFVDEPHSARSRARARARSSTSPTVAPRLARRRSSTCSRARADRIVDEVAALDRRSAAGAGAAARIWSCRRITTCAPRMCSSAACTARSPRRPSAGPMDFAELLLTPGVGARTVQSLAMVAEVIHGAPYRFADPARFSLAHGGKDRHPFPVPLKVYDETIRVLKTAVNNARLGRDEELQR